MGVKDEKSSTLESEQHAQARLHDLEQKLAQSKQRIARLEAELDQAINTTQKYQTLIDVLPTGISLTDPQGNLVESNPTSEALLGISRSEHDSRRYDGPEWNIIGRNGRQLKAQEFTSVKALTQNRPVLNEIMGLVRGPNDTVWIQVSAAPVPMDEFGVAIAYLDVSNQVEIQERLIDVEDRLRRQLDEMDKLYQHAPVGLFTLDNELRYIRINDRLAKINRMSPEAHIGKRFPDLLPKIAESVMPILRKVLAGQAIAGHEFIGQTTDSDKIPRSWIGNYYPLQDSDGNIVGVSGALLETTQHQKAELKIRKQNRLLSELGELARIGSWEWEPQSDELTLTDFLYDLHEIPRDEKVTLTSLMTLYPAATVDYLNGIWQKIRTVESTSLDMELDIYTATGKHRRVHFLVNTVEHDGHVVRVSGSMQDITESWKNAEALHHNRQQLKSFLSAVDDIISFRELDGNYTLLNNSIESITGYAKSEFDNDPELLTRITHQDDLDIVRNFFENYAGKVRSFELQYRLRHKNGEWIWVQSRMAAVFDKNGIRGYNCVDRDITESRRAMLQIRKSEKQFKAIFDSSPMGMLMYTMEGTRQLILTDANPASAHITNSDISRLIGKRLEDAFPALVGTALPEAFISAALLGERFYQNEVPYDDGNISGTFEVMAFQLQPRTLLVSFRDITQTLRLQEQLRQSQKMEAIGRLAGGIAHEFNNLLTGITGNVTLAMMDLSPQDSQYHMLGEVREAARRTAELVDQLLAFSRRRIIAPKQISVNSNIIAIRRLLERLIGEDVILSTDLYGELNSIHADSAQIDQILINLSILARDAMPEGGHLMIKTENVTLDDQFIPSHSDPVAGDYICLIIEDSGEGMDAKTTEHLFEPFFKTTSQETGRGLGLAMIYGAIQQHKGLINIVSKPGQGTRIEIYFPITGPPIAGEKLTPENSTIASSGKGETILVVEDERIVRKLASKALIRAGYNVLEAEHGLEALDVVTEYSGKIDMLLTDIVMPHLNGKELAKRMLIDDPNLVVLYMSGYTTSILEDDDGVVPDDIEMLRKPFTPNDLVEIVQRHLKKGR